jgi:hypothetical protein
VYLRYASKVVTPKRHNIFDLFDSFFAQYTPLISVRFSSHPVAQDKEFHFSGIGAALETPGFK